MRLLGRLFPLQQPFQRRHFSSTSLLLSSLSRPRFPFAIRKNVWHPDPVLEEGQAFAFKDLTWLLRHGARHHEVRIEPDGYVAVSDILSNPRYDRFTLDSIREMAEMDTRDRIQIKEEYNTHRTKVWVRVSGHHSIPWVHPGAKKLASSAKSAWDSMALPFSQLFYLTTREDWRTIRTEGIKAGHSFIHLKQDIPDHYGLRSGHSFSPVVVVINASVATRFGVSFYSHPTGEILTTGDSSGYIDPQTFRAAFAIQWEHESLVGQHEPWLRPRDPRKRHDSRHLIPDKNKQRFRKRPTLHYPPIQVPTRTKVDVVLPSSKNKDPVESPPTPSANVMLQPQYQIDIHRSRATPPHMQGTAITMKG